MAMTEKEILEYAEELVAMANEASTKGMAMTEKEILEYAEELVARANEASTKGEEIHPQQLIDLIQRRGEVTDQDDQVKIPQLTSDLLHAQETQDNADQEAGEGEVAEEATSAE